ncbi:BatB protein [Marinomonas sp. S3726]|uniref:vWA domain-containing protein n=1 Tax=Marinomonas sp. S3726 TaxID=579484 RepID=UPI0005FA3AA4|nr:VWA domain-containing protein [Marinomonas sp. S3726]KJZ14261.1 BatB protein [Marinomonas sp. S3726]
MLEFIWPWFLIVAIAPFFLKFGRPAEPDQKALWWPNITQFNQTEISIKLKRQSFSKHLIKLFLWISWLLLVIAIARPVWLGEPKVVTPSGRDLLIALDLSGSMQTADMKINQQAVDRLQAAKQVLDRFIKERKGDRIGIIVFGSKAYLQAPLSYDLDTIAQLVNETQIGFAGENTAIGDAIGLGIKRLANIDADKRVMILMTDGANTAGRVKPDQAAQFAAKQGVKIHTIGIGAEQMISQGFFGPRVINPSTDLDEELLQKIADMTEGQYFRAKSTQELESIYATLDELEPTPGEDQWQRPKTTLFNMIALGSLFFLFLALYTRWNAIRRGSF